MVQRWKFPELDVLIFGDLISYQDHEKASALPVAIVYAMETCSQAGCRGQHVGDIMSQLVLGKAHGEARWSCAVHVLTLGRTDLLDNRNAWPPVTSFLQGFV